MGLARLAMFNQFSNCLRSATTKVAACDRSRGRIPAMSKLRPCSDRRSHAHALHVDFRITNSGRKRTVTGGRSGSMMRLSRSSIACLPTSYAGCRTTVGGGALLGPGVALDADQSTEALFLGTPFTRWRAGERVSPPPAETTFPS